MSPLTRTLTLFLGALLAVPAVPARAQDAPHARMRVLVPAFETEARPRSGEQLAELVRRRIAAMATHAPTESRPVRDALRRFNLREEQLDCTQWVQLASHVEASLVLCGRVDDATQLVTARFVNLAGDAFEVPAFTMQSAEQAAQHVVQAFETYVRQLALVSFCHDYLNSSNWDAALRNCTQALVLNPRSVSANYGRGSAFSELGQLDSALVAFRTVLDIEPLNQDALLHAGILAAKLEDRDLSQSFFRRYLELNPGNEQVRLSIATDLANAGDPAGALLLVESAIEAGTPSGVLWEYAGHFAMNAAIREGERATAGVAGADAAARELYGTAVRHYDRAVALRGDSLDVTVYRSLMLAHSRLGHDADAIVWGERATQHAPGDAQAWMIYAEVLGNMKRTEDALRAFDRVAAINPQTPNLAARRVVLLLDAGRVNDVVAMLRTAVGRGELQQDMAERLAQQMAVKGFQLTRDDRYEQAIVYLRAAREAGRTDETHAMANFFEAWNLIRQGAPALQAANAKADDARRVRPLFERAKTLLENASAYREQDAQRQQLLKQVAQFLDVADALIRAGR